MAERGARTATGRRLAALTVVLALALSSCGVVETAGDVVYYTGKVLFTVVKTTGEVIVWTGKGVVSTVRYFAGRRTAKLERVGDSYYVQARIDDEEEARLVLDTGATSVQISSLLAERLGIGPDAGRAVQCTLAGGRVVPARLVTLDSVEVGGACVENVRALVLRHEGPSRDDGLLGMSFLGHFVFQIDTDEDELVMKPREERERE